jgi:hypothetical protein
MQKLNRGPTYQSGVFRHSSFGWVRTRQNDPYSARPLTPPRNKPKAPIVDARQVRRDITEGKPGVPLRLLQW